MGRELRVGFEVPQWINKSTRDYTNEELLEFWHMLRFTCRKGPFTLEGLAVKDFSSYALVVDLQDEILKRMGGK